MNMFRRIKRFIKDIWIRLTWCHIISFHPKTEIIEDGKWYTLNYYIKKEGKSIILEDMRISIIEEKF